MDFIKEFFTEIYLIIMARPVLFAVLFIGWLTLAFVAGVMDGRRRAEVQEEVEDA
jgi:hypothetical protein